MRDERERRHGGCGGRMRLVGDGAAVASCPIMMRRGGDFLPDEERRWLLARCGAVVASCRGPMLCRGGFLPDAARRWLLARCGAAVASCPMLRGSGVLPEVRMLLMLRYYMPLHVSCKCM